MCSGSRRPLVLTLALTCTYWAWPPDGRIIVRVASIGTRDSLTADRWCNAEFSMPAQIRMHVTGTSTNFSRWLSAIPD